MQNLNDFLSGELRENQRIFVPAGKGKTSFVDTRDLAEVVCISFRNTKEHQNRKYVITGDEALDFFKVTEIMTEVMHIDIQYSNPSVKEFKEYMLKKGAIHGTKIKRVRHSDLTLNYYLNHLIYLSTNLGKIPSNSFFLQ